MRKYLFALLVLVAAGTTLLVAAFAVAGGGSHNISAKDGLTGIKRRLDLVHDRQWLVRGKVANDDSSFDWTLTYGDLEGTVTQAHIHFGGRSLNGGISIWLCGTASIPARPGRQRARHLAERSAGQPTQATWSARPVKESQPERSTRSWRRSGAARRTRTCTARRGPAARSAGQLNDPDGK